MRILFIGDICGKNARKAVAKYLSGLSKKQKPSVVIGNVENLTHGRGASIKAVTDLQKCGVDVMTSGNHIWRNKDYTKLLTDPQYPVIRPLNYPEDIVGKGFFEFETSEGNLLVVNLLGFDHICTSERTVIEPFRLFKAFIEKIKLEDYAAILIDFHAEMTSEKKAFGKFFNGKVSAILGTHTHVQTADEEILSNGTAYITDVGMVGPKDSILWTKKEVIFNRMMYPYGQFFEISDDKEIIFNAVNVEVGPDRKAQSIERINTIIKL